MALLICLLAFYTLLLIIHSVRMVGAHAELNYAESTWLFAALRVRHGLSIYFNYQQPPYIPMIYPPLDPEIAGWVGTIIGGSDNRVIVLDRLVSLGATILASAAIYVVCRRLGAGRLPALLGALLFFTPTHIFYLWSYVARSDMLAVALGMCAMVCVLIWQRRWGLLAGGALAGLAIASKQDAVAPLLACAWWLLAPGHRKGLLPLFAGALGGITLSLAPVGPDGVQQFLAATSDLFHHPWLDAVYEQRLEDLVTLSGLVAPVALLGIVRGVNYRADGEAALSRQFGLILRYGAIALLVMAFASGKIGSASSYCLEVIAILCVLAGLGTGWLFTANAPREVAMGMLVLALAPLAIQTWLALKVAGNWREAVPDERPFIAMLDKRQGPVLSDNGYLLLHGADPPFILDPLFFSVQSSVGRWNPETLRQMASGAQFSAVVLTYPIDQPTTSQGIPWMPDSVDQIVKQKYTLETTFGRYYIYVPRLPGN